MVKTKTQILKEYRHNKTVAGSMGRLTKDRFLTITDDFDYRVKQKPTKLSNGKVIDLSKNADMGVFDLEMEIQALQVALDMCKDYINEQWKKGVE